MPSRWEQTEEILIHTDGETGMVLRIVGVMGKKVVEKKAEQPVNHWTKAGLHVENM